MSKEYLIEKLKLEKVQVDRAIETIDELPDNMPASITAITSSSHFTLFVKTVSPDDFKRTRRLLGRNAKFRNRTFFGKTGARVHVYDWGSGKCELQLMLVSGEACHRIQVGERTEPVYQVVCD